MGFGGGSQQTSSSSNTASWANNFLNSMSQSVSGSSGQSQSFIDPMQQGFLQDLWGQGAQQADPGAVTAASRGMVNRVMPGMRAADRTLAGLSNPNQQIAAQQRSLKAGLGNLFATEINPAIQGDAIEAGGYGGGRQGVAEGVAAGQLGNTYAQALGDITAGANQQAGTAAGMRGQLAPAMYNLGMMPSMAGFAPLQAMQGLLGSPTVLSQAWQEAMSRGTSRSRGGGTSRSIGTSESSGSGWNFEAAFK